MDERMFSDTVIRVVKLSKDIYIACDIRYLNGKNLFETLSFADRKSKLIELLDVFHHPDLATLFTIDHVPNGTLLRGYESYDDQPGTLGVFLPADE